MALLFVDKLPPWQQRLLGLLPAIFPYPHARRLLIRTDPGYDPREVYLASMRLEVIWLGSRYLKKQFLHQGVEHIEPERAYVITSLHFGQWGMYPASLYQQTGIASQMIMTARNRRPSSFFWRHFGHARQHLSGYPGSYSTEGFFQHTNRLKQGINQISILDVRERGLQQKEVAVDFMGGPYYLPRTVPLLAKRAGVQILPYIGFYDPTINKHRVTWYRPVSPQPSDRETLQQIVNCFEPSFRQHPEMYFNVLAHHRTPLG